MLRWIPVLLVACDAGAPPKPAPHPDPPPAAAALPASGRHKHAILTADLSTPSLAVALPKHGVVLETWGPISEDTLVLDSDAGTMRQISDLVIKTHSDRRRIVAPAKVKATMAAAFAAWDEEPYGPMPSTTGVRNDLYVIDGDEAFYLSGTPIGGYGKTGRPLAVQALTAMFVLAPGP